MNYKDYVVGMKSNKFKAWDKLDKIMYENVYFSRFDGTYFIDGSCDIGDLIFLQYTGLKDKNGKDICEGDIVKTEWYSDWDYDETIPHTGVVKYHEKLAGFGFPVRINGEHKMPLQNYVNLLAQCDIDRTEVIGNIFENENLLIQKKKS